MFRKRKKQAEAPRQNEPFSGLERSIANWQEAHERLNASLASPVKRRILKVIFDHMISVCSTQLANQRNLNFSALLSTVNSLPTLEAEMNIMHPLQECARLHDDPFLVEIERLVRPLPLNSRLRQNLQHECSVAALELQTRRAALHQKVQAGALCVTLLAFYANPELGMCTLGVEMLVYLSGSVSSTLNKALEFYDTSGQVNNDYVTAYGGLKDRLNEEAAAPAYASPGSRGH